MKKVLVNLLVYSSLGNCISDAVGQVSRGGISRSEMIYFKI